MMVSVDNENGENSGAGSASSSSSSFPLARVKKIMKADKDVNLVSAEAVHLTSIASELFLEFIVKKATDASQTEKRRTILYKDFAGVVKSDPRLNFLNDLIPEPVSIQSALEAQRARGVGHVVNSVPQSPAAEARSTEDVASEAEKTKSNSSSIAEFFAKRSASSSTAADIDIEDQ